MRDMAIAALRVNLDGLLERSRKRMLTPVERAEVDRLTLTIDTLQSMGG
jgi:hypothetical protein